jgi:tetratricopeptide (TPR) repeat protein
MISALNELALLHNDCGRPEASIELAREGLALAERSQFSRGVPYCHQRLAEAYFALGALDASAEHARRVLEAIRAGGDRTLEPVCRLRLGLVEARRGNAAAALAELQNAAQLALEMKTPRMQFAIALGYARYCLLRERTDEARALLSLVRDNPGALHGQRRAAAAELAALGDSSAAAPTAADSLDPRPALERLLSEPCL